VTFPHTGPGDALAARSGLLHPALAFTPIRVRHQINLECRAMLPQTVPVRAAAIVGIVELNRIVLPAADPTDLVGARRSLVKRDEPAAGARELAVWRFAGFAEEAIRNPHVRILGRC
jgi:hypothetical protein